MFTLFSLILLTFINWQSANIIESRDENNDAKPNILLIIADDQGWGDLSINGNPYLKTPSIDSIAFRGARFERFYVSPVCSPTRAEILTGRYHVRTGVSSTSAGGERIDLDEKLLPEYFRDAGYRTAAFGKWHSGQQYPYHPNDRGFEEFYGFCSGHWANYFSPSIEHNGRITRGDGYLTDDLTSHAMAYMAEQDDRPFLIYLALNTPHSPMQVPDEWWNNVSDTVYSHRYAHKEDREHTKAAYAMVKNIDWNVGRLMHQLNHLGMTENTIVIYMSDNGPNGWRWNDGLEGIKGHTDEGGVRSPLHIAWQGRIGAGQEISYPMAAIDLLPTLAALTGIQPDYKNPIDGRDLSSVLLSDKSPDDRSIFSHWRNNVSVRNQKYILNSDNQLYDLSTDPGQKSDLSKIQIDAYNALRDEKSIWMKEVLSELNSNDTRPFTVGGTNPVHLPAADGIAHGNIERSNRYPNSSYFTNWRTSYDSISWNINVLDEGYYEATMYYTAGEKEVGTAVQLKYGNSTISGKIPQAHKPVIRGAEHDRIPRQESYFKDFKPMSLGRIFLEKSQGMLVLQAGTLKGQSSLETNLLVLTQVR